MPSLFRALAASYLTVVGVTALSADMPPGGAPHGPPPEAIAACNGKSAGTTVSFTGRGGNTMSGVCELQNGVLAARPAGMPPQGSPPGNQK